MEDTKVIEQENAELIEKMLREAEKADEPGSADRIINRGDSTNPAPMVVTEIKSAGYSYVYDTKTGERSTVNNNMLPSQLRKKRPDGSFVFTLKKPDIEVKRGTYKCMLHASDPNRAYYDTLGLPVCPKDNLTAPVQVRRHMQKRHKMEWEIIEGERIERERQHDRRLQESLILAAGGKLDVALQPIVALDTTEEVSKLDWENAPTYESDKPKETKKKTRKKKKK